MEHHARDSHAKSRRGGLPVAELEAPYLESETGKQIKHISSARGDDHFKYIGRWRDREIEFDF